MAQSNNILEELKELNSSLAGNALSVPMQVPDGYFDALPGLVMAKIKAVSSSGTDESADISPLLSSISKDMPYTVPQEYFQSLDTRLASIIRDHQSAKEELESLSPLLGGLKKEVPFTVPEGYFESIQPKINHQPARIVSMAPRKWLKYAVAAILIGIIATTVVLVRDSEKLDPDTNSYSWVEKKMKKVSTDEIENFVELSDEVLPQNEIVANNAKANEVKELIKDIPVNEIEAFLTDIPQEENVSEEDDALLN